MAIIPNLKEMKYEINFVIGGKKCLDFTLVKAEI